MDPSFDYYEDYQLFNAPPLLLLPFINQIIILVDDSLPCVITSLSLDLFIPLTPIACFMTMLSSHSHERDV